MRHKLYEVRRPTGDRPWVVEIFLNTSFAIGFSLQPFEDFIREALIIHVLFVEIRCRISCFKVEFLHHTPSLREKLIALFNGAIVTNSYARFRSMKDADHYLWLMRSEESASEIDDDYWSRSDDECEDQYPYEDYE